MPTEQGYAEPLVRPNNSVLVYTKDPSFFINGISKTSPFISVLENCKVKSK